MTIRPVLAAAAAAGLTLGAAGAANAKQLNTDLDWDRVSAAHITNTTGYEQGFRLGDLKPGQTITLTTTVDRVQSAWNANGTNFDRFGFYPTVDGTLTRMAGAPVFETQTNNGAVGNPVCVSGVFEASGFLGADHTCANPLDASGQASTRAGGTLRYTVTVTHDGTWTGSVTPLDADGLPVNAFVGATPTWQFAGELPDRSATYTPYLRVYGGSGSMTLTISDTDIAISAPGNGHGQANGWAKR